MERKSLGKLIMANNSDRSMAER